MMKTLSPVFAVMEAGADADYAAFERAESLCTSAASAAPSGAVYRHRRTLSELPSSPGQARPDACTSNWRVPAELRNRQGWRQGDALLFIEAPDGVVLMTREQAKVLVRKQLAGRSLVEELMAERRVVAAREDLA